MAWLLLLPLLGLVLLLLNCVLWRGRRYPASLLTNLIALVYLLALAAVTFLGVDKAKPLVSAALEVARPQVNAAVAAAAARLHGVGAAPKPKAD